MKRLLIALVVATMLVAIATPAWADDDSEARGMTQGTTGCQDLDAPAEAQVEAQDQQEDCDQPCTDSQDDCDGSPDDCDQSCTDSQDDCDGSPDDCDQDCDGSQEQCRLEHQQGDEAGPEGHGYASTKGPGLGAGHRFAHRYAHRLDSIEEATE